ncbi:MAG TPA: amidohydrolase family protein [Chloroflexota bacterium]
MLIDVNAYLGHFAFRQLRFHTGPTLLALMDGAGIDQAVVSSASAITYRNVQAGNEEVAAEVRGHRDRFISFAVINPCYAGWRDDLTRCHEELGMTGLRLYPNWHAYHLADPSCLELVQEAGERRMTISIAVRAEDPRQRHWLVDVPDVALEEIAALVQHFPQTQFLVVNGINFVRSSLGRKDNGLPPNYHIELSRLSALLQNEIGTLLDHLGPERIVFGTGMPFAYPGPALLKLEVLAASDAVKEQIAWKNAARLLARVAADDRVLRSTTSG